MRKKKVGYQFTLHLDEETAEFIIRLAKIDCRSPESAARAIIIKDIRKKLGKSGEDLI